MSKTGATDAQILAAVPRFHEHFGTLDRFEINAPEATRNNSYMTIDEAAAFLVPPDSRIVSVADLNSLIRKASESPNPTRESEALLDRIRALIGDN